MSENLIRIQREDDDLVIRLSVDGLVHVTEHYPEANYKVVNKDEFVRQVIFQLNNIGSFSNDTGRTRLEELFDTAINEVYCDGNDCIIDEEFEFKD